MHSIAFFDLEVDPQSRRILDFGCMRNESQIFHKGSIIEFVQFIKGTDFVCVHNVNDHDPTFLGSSLEAIGIRREDVIDTLYLSSLLFPTNPHHRLPKDDIPYEDAPSNPLNDSIKAGNLLYERLMHSIV